MLLVQTAHNGSFALPQNSSVSFTGIDAVKAALTFVTSNDLSAAVDIRDLLSLRFLLTRENIISAEALL